MESTHSLAVFCPLRKKSSDNPYLKFLDFSRLLVADTPIKKCFPQIPGPCGTEKSVVLRGLMARPLPPLKGLDFFCDFPRQIHVFFKIIRFFVLFFTN